ncbi:MAG: hypothetical protein G8345_04000 [Magnetococcales bacterium]|nr:hypothetical protein [Magnetococcales bacterium]NGZ26034.1 hypothetical protein [Magnetococcales bacterium]
MADVVRYLFQAVFYLCFCALVYALSVWPPYQYLRPDQGEIKISFKHSGQHVEPCRELSKEELMKLPPNMRKATKCSRERSPLQLELLLDGKLLAKRSYRPSGLSRDGASFVYAKFPVPAGSHRLTIQMNDSVREPDSRLAGEKQLKLTPGQALVIGFDSVDKTFTFH